MANIDQADDFDPLRNITAYINDLDTTQVQDEAFIYYGQKQTLELQQDIEKQKKGKEEKEKEIETLVMILQQLKEDHDRIIQTVEILPKLNTSMRQLIHYKHNEMDEWKAKCDKSIKEFMRQHEDTRKQHANITPLHAEYQKTNMVCFESSIRLKIQVKKLEEEKEKEMLRKKLNNRLHNQKIVSFARESLNYYKWTNKRDRSIPKPIINLTDSRNEPAKGHIMSRVAELEELAASRAIPKYKYDQDWNHTSTLAELPRINWGEMTLRMTQTMKGWRQSLSSSFSTIPDASNAQNVKRSLVGADEKINIISVKKIKTATLPPVGTSPKKGPESPPSQLIDRFVEPQNIPKPNMVESKNSSFSPVVTSTFFNKPKTPAANIRNRIAFQTNSGKSLPSTAPPTGNLLPPTGNLMPPIGNLAPPTGNLLPPTGNLMPPMGNLMPPTGNLIPPTHNLMPETSNLFAMPMEPTATPCMNSPFNDDQFMMMSPSGSVDMEMPSFNVSADFNNIPSFMANPNQPSTNSQSGPISLFTNAGANPFKMFN
ncbi:hypothetical protein PPYR_00900 [Photinus pyralis]|uniref:Uncharacterized protein n=1 Tax=Photinus pyralis TaxID=7054 RepID=A0A5N4B3H6_PHOPY|nr:hypothetical protein PPYR_00900 [Photinus pyralis]